MMSPVHPLLPIKGRGAATAMAHRFDPLSREAFDDGWDPRADGQVAPPLLTEVRLEDARSAITRNDSPDIPFEQSLNPYRGCEHGCVYCFARPTHSYLGLSPGLDFESRLIVKRNLVEVLRRELTARSYRPLPVVIGTATDAYQPIEREWQLTRRVLQLLSDCAHPLSIVTKGSGVLRDRDLLGPMGRSGLAAVYVTVTTLDAQLCRQLEPRAAAPHRRLRIIRELADAGIPVGVSVAPQIPFLNDDMEQVLEAAAEAGATRAFYTVLRLPWEVAPLFEQWLALHHPQRSARVMARVREMRAGRDYDSRFGSRMHGVGVWADLLRQRFDRAVLRLGLNRDRTPLDTSRFDPARLGPQASLF
ncbi:MAG: PA0069 family radical SAM protein [Rhodoferax sp.]|nr:PA0069 family radical SAM protein [Rhodoferax sp.]